MLRRPIIYLTWSTMKMWSRDRGALFWTFFLPLVIMVIFGLLNFGELGKLDIGIVDEAQNEGSFQFVEGLASVAALRIEQGTSQSERQALSDGQRDLVIILPDGFGVEGQTSQVQALYHASRANETQVGLNILQSAIDQLNFSITGAERGGYVAERGGGRAELGLHRFSHAGGNRHVDYAVGVVQRSVQLCNHETRGRAASSARHTTEPRRRCWWRRYSPDWWWW